MDDRAFGGSTPTWPGGRSSSLGTQVLFPGMGHLNELSHRH
jgi:hypothetical protein